MKLRLLATLGLISITTTSFAAVQITKGHLIQHKEWTTGNIKVAYKKANGQHMQDQLLKVKELKAKKAKLKDNEDDTTFTYIDTYSEHTEGDTSNTTPVNGEHFVYIENDTNQAQYYAYTFSTCAESSSPTTKLVCAYSYDSFLLEPMGSAYLGDSPELEINYTMAGSYKFNASIEFEKLKMINSFMYLPESVTNSNSTNTIDIADKK